MLSNPCRLGQQVDRRLPMLDEMCPCSPTLAELGSKCAQIGKNWATSPRQCVRNARESRLTIIIEHLLNNFATRARRPLCGGGPLPVVFGHVARAARRAPGTFFFGVFVAPGLDKVRPPRGFTRLSLHNFCQNSSISASSSPCRRQKSACGKPPYFVSPGSSPTPPLSRPSDKSAKHVQKMLPRREHAATMIAKWLPAGRGAGRNLEICIEYVRTMLAEAFLGQLPGAGWQI